MATLSKLRPALLAHFSQHDSLRPLSPHEHDQGFQHFAGAVRDVGAVGLTPPPHNTYKQFIAHELSMDMERVLGGRAAGEEQLSVLDVDPGMHSALEWLPEAQRRRVGAYTACVSDDLPDLARGLRNRLVRNQQRSPRTTFPCLRAPPVVVHNAALDPGGGGAGGRQGRRFHLILLGTDPCGRQPTARDIRRAVGMLAPRGAALVFRRDRALSLGGGGVVADTEGTVEVADTPGEIETFANLVAGRVPESLPARYAVQSRWRETVRGMAGRSRDGMLVFRTPTVKTVYRAGSIAPERPRPKRSRAPRRAGEITMDNLFLFEDRDCWIG